MLRLRQTIETRRRHHGDAGGRLASVEGDSDRTGALLVQRMRDDHTAAGAVPRDAARLRRAISPGNDSVREVRSTPAAQSPERALRPRGGGSELVDAGRPVGSCALALRLLYALIEAQFFPPSACTATTRRFRSLRKARPRPAESRLTSATTAVRRQGPACGALLRLARSLGRTSRAASRRLRRYSASKRL
jgi:hypothetical protein